MRNEFAKTIFDIGKKNKDIYILVADISPAGKMFEFEKKFPDRYINVGVAEQSMIGMGAGLAMTGKRPFLYTISTFALYRPFEMVRVDLCYQNIPVCLVGMGAGTIYANLGATHLTQEDISVARSIPNMQVLAPSDPLELRNCIKFCSKESNKPTYLRIGKSGEQTYNFKESEKWKFGKIRKLVNGTDICILSFGPIIKKAFEVKEILKKKKISTKIYSCHTLKPFDKERIKKIFKKFKKIIIIEDHSEIGGLASIVKSLAYEFKFTGILKCFSLKDKFFSCYSNQDDLLKKHGISTKDIIKSI